MVRQLIRRWQERERKQARVLVLALVLRTERQGLDSCDLEKEELDSRTGKILSYNSWLEHEICWHILWGIMMGLGPFTFAPPWRLQPVSTFCCSRQSGPLCCQIATLRRQGTNRRGISFLDVIFGSTAQHLRHQLALAAAGTFPLVQNDSRRPKNKENCMKTSRPMKQRCTGGKG